MVSTFSNHHNTLKKAKKSYRGCTFLFLEGKELVEKLFVVTVSGWNYPLTWLICQDLGQFSFLAAVL